MSKGGVKQTPSSRETLPRVSTGAHTERCQAKCITWVTKERPCQSLVGIWLLCVSFRITRASMWLSSGLMVSALCSSRYMMRSCYKNKYIGHLQEAMASEVREPVSRSSPGSWRRKDFGEREAVVWLKWCLQDRITLHPPETQLIRSTAAAPTTFKLFPGFSRWNKGLRALGVGGTLFLAWFQLSSQFCGISPWCSGQGLVTARCMVLYS